MSANKAALGETKNKRLEKTTKRQLYNLYFYTYYYWSEVHQEGLDS
jgi:hypothetical protein